MERSLIASKSKNEKLFNMIRTGYEDRKANRGTFDSHWQEIADLMHPFSDNFNAEGSPGENKTMFMFDSSPMHANQLLASGLFSMLTSPTQQWFEIAMMNYELMQLWEVKDWLDIVSRIMFFEINKPQAHFNTSMHELYLEYGAFGNGILYVGETLDRRNLRFQSLPLAESYLSEGAEGLMDSLFRRYPRTVRQLVAKFGYGSCSETVQKMFDKQKLDTVIKCVHAIVPAIEYDIDVDFPYVSIYIDLENKHVMAGKIYNELPFMAPRFYKSPWEQYGRGAGSVALPDVKMLMEVMRTTLRAAQKATDPPLQAPDDGFLNPIRTMPGGINFYRSGTQDRIEPIKLGSQPGLGYEVIGDLRERIREVFFVDQLQLQEGPQMTATEVLQRTEEKLRLMGPLMGRLQSELLGPMLNRVYGILKRQGKIPPIPVVMQGQEFKIVYTSPISRAQEQVEANGLMRALQVLTPFMEMKPETVDAFNTDEISKGVFDMFSVRPKFLNTDTQIATIRQQRAEQMQQDKVPGNLQSAGQGFEAMTRAGINMREMGLQ